MSANSHRYVIIVAGGRGTRMGHDLPKQFLPLEGRPVLMHTIALWASCCSQCIVVLPEDQQAFWQSLCCEHQFTVPHQVVAGGPTRFHSVSNGLSALGATEGLVAIHDGVRPLVSPQTIERCFVAAQQHGAAVPTMPLVESLRQLTGKGSSISVPRTDYVAVQTPQVFDLPQIVAAYQQPYQAYFTDDASVYEAAYPDKSPALVAGNVENIKLTTPADLRLAAILLTSQS